MNWAVVGKDDPSQVRGGLNTYCDGLVAALRSSGLVVEWFAAGTQPGRDLVPIGGDNALGRALRFYRAGRKFDGAVVNSHFPLYGVPFIYGARAGAAMRRRARAGSRPTVVVNFHGPWGEESAVAAGGQTLGTRIKTALDRHQLRLADKVVVLSEVFRDKAVELGADSSKVRVVRPGISTEWVEAPGHVEVDSGVGPTNLVCVRRLTPRMGHLALLRSLERLNFAVDGREVVLHLVGIGEMASDIEDWVRAADRERSVHCHGALDHADLVRLMRRCDAAIVPTTALEGFGLVVLEAMAVGLPVISTGQGGLSEAMGPWGHRPWVISLGDVPGLHEAIRAARELGQAERERLREYAQSHTWRVAAESVRSIAEAS